MKVAYTDKQRLDLVLDFILFGLGLLPRRAMAGASSSTTTTTMVSLVIASTTTTAAIIIATVALAVAATATTTVGSVCVCVNRNCVRVIAV